MHNLNILVVGDDFTPFHLFEEHLRAQPSLGDANITGFDIGPDSPTPPDLEVSEYFGDPKVVMERIGDIEVLVTTFAPVTMKVIDSAKRLKLIACARGGPVNVNISYATKKGIPVLFTPGRNVEAVADFTMGLIICLCRKIPRADKFVRSGEWRTTRQDTLEKPTGVELHGRTLGVVGFGRVGFHVCQRAKAFGLKILVHDPFIKECGEKLVDLDTLLRKSDIVTVHARISDDSSPSISTREFQLMKKEAYLVNTSRPATVDEDALHDALITKKIAGAALDVHRTEPLPLSSRLLSLDNILLTPHVAGVSVDIPARTCEMIAEELDSSISGRRPKFVFNPEVFKSLKTKFIT